MSNLIIGMGQIGQAVYQVVKRNHDTQTLDRDNLEVVADIDVMHICFPYSDNFAEEVVRYIRAFRPKHTVVWSTVPIGTCAEIDPFIAHSPVEGRHPDLELSIRTMERWVGVNEPAEGKFLTSYFQELGLRVRVVDSTDYTEFLKLRSTSKYGINIVWTDYEAYVADELGMDFELLRDFDKAYNKLYHELGVDWAQRYVLHPPDGAIGGHCITPNAKLLNQQFPSELLDKIIEMEIPE